MSINSIGSSELYSNNKINIKPQPDNSNKKMQSEYEAVLHQYDGYSTPIADSMNIYLSVLQNHNVHSGTNNLTDVPTGDANNLNTFFNSAKFSNDPNEAFISSSLVNMEKQLSSLYSQFKQDNNVDYSNESVEDIAKKFGDYSSDEVTGTADISGTKFTYKDIVSATEVLNDAFAVSSTSNTVDAYHAALGDSEVSYVAIHDMTSSAGALLLQEYNKHIYNQESNANKATDSDYFNEAYKELKNLDVSSDNAFKNSFNNVIKTYLQNSYDNSYTKELQSSFNTFTKQFLS